MKGASNFSNLYLSPLNFVSDVLNKTIKIQPFIYFLNEGCEQLLELISLPS